MRGFGGFERRESAFFAQEKPVKEGELHDVEITEVGSKGDGITKIKNFVIFVAGTKKGDKIKVKITSVKRSCAIAEKVDAAAVAAAATAAPVAEAAVAEAPATEAKPEGPGDDGDGEEGDENEDEEGEETE